MAGISVRGTTYNLPNFHGELIQLTPEDTPFLSAIGGLSEGGQSTEATEFEWQTTDLRTASDQRQRLEGADAQTADNRVRANISNIVEVHQETIDVAYSKLAAVGQYAGINAAGGANTPNPVMNEKAFQIDAALRAKALDIEATFFTGQYRKPADNTLARRTRGIIEATPGTNVEYGGTTVLQNGTAADSTNAVTVTAHGYANGDLVAFTALTGGSGLRLNWPYFVINQTANTFKVAATAGGTEIDITADYSALTVTKCDTATGDDVLNLLQKVWESGGIRETAAATLFVGAAAKRLVTKLFITDKGYQEQTRNVGGVNLLTFESDFGRLNLALSRYMPANAFQLVSLDQCAPVFLEVPGKGVMFVEDLAKIGASERSQLYGEVGLKYGNPNAHGRLVAKA